jgi:hypothetical protein
MITIPTEFDRETENVYWQSISEIIRDQRILDAYDKLHLIRLKNFIEDEIRHRKSYVEFYLVSLKDLDVYRDWQIDLKKRIEKMISERSLFYKRHSTFINESEIKLFQKDIDFILASAIQYGQSFKVLEALKLTLNTILNKPKQPEIENKIVLHEKEADNNIILSLNNEIKKITEGTLSFDKTKEPDNKIDPKYLNKKGEKFQGFQISWILFFEQKNIQNPKYDDNDILKKIVFSYGFKKHTSAQNIFDKYFNKIKMAHEEENELKKRIESVHLKTNKSKNSIQKDIKKIIPLLDPKNQKTAKSYVDALEKMIN